MAKIGTPKGTGYFFRREKQVHYGIDDGPKDAQIYYCLRNHGAKKTICMYTTDKKEAQRRLDLFGEAFELDSKQKYLHAIVKLGKWAEKKLKESI